MIYKLLTLCQLLGIFFLFLAGAPLSVKAQITFQKTYSYSTGFVQTYDAIECSDGGYAMAGTADIPSSEMMLMKLDCEGNPQWSMAFGEAETINNEYCKVIETPDNRLILMHSSGSNFASTMDLVLVKLSLDGNLIWKKSYGGAGNDVGRDMSLTADGMLVVTGSTSSIGSDLGAGLRDLLLFKVDLDGNLEWSKSFGNVGSIEDSYAVTELSGSTDLAITGRLIVNGTFHAFVMRTDFNGNLIWARAIGQDDHYTAAEDILSTSNGELLITGGTTIARLDFESMSDPFLVKLDASNGELINSKVYLPANDQSDTGSRIIPDSNGGYLISFGTMSYSDFTDGLEPNKHGLFRIGSNGELQEALILNTGGSYFPGIRQLQGDGYLYFGYSSQYADPCCNSQPLLIRMDGNLNSGCNQNDVLALTDIQDGNWVLEEISSSEDSGIIEFSLSGFTEFSFDGANTLCEDFPPISVDFAPAATCLGEVISLDASTTGSILNWNWDLGNGDELNGENIEYGYQEVGLYTVTLEVSDGCQTRSATQDVEIYSNPEPNAGEDSSINEGDSIELGGSPTGSPDWNYEWDNPTSLSDQSSPNPSANPLETTLYTISVTDAFGCTGSDEVLIEVIEAVDPPVVPPAPEGEYFIPNIFSPNGDEFNDVLQVYGGPYESFKLEIFNRWGLLVFESEDPTEGWDGTFKGEKAPSAVYYFQVRAKFASGESIEDAGNISLIR